MRRPVSVKSVFSYQGFFRLSQAASVAILPSALFVSDVRSVPVGCSRSVGAATCESTSRPTFSVRVGPQDLVAVTWTRRLSSALRTQFYATVLTPSQRYCFSKAGLLSVALRARRPLGAYSIPPETGLLIPSVKRDYRILAFGVRHIPRKGLIRHYPTGVARGRSE